MNSIKKLIIFFLVLFYCRIEAKVFKRCELARALKNVYHVPSNQLATWMCIANFESHYDTSAINTSTGDHGLFQISQIYWCSNSRNPGKSCNTQCSKFRDNNIRDDVACAKKIYQEHQRISGNGFTAWVAYNRYCRGNVSQYVKGCF
ncbi:Lys domain containing protein [Asbolus verrucosus]|uniref:lysozyme n=1 Tax=Asbolus verrucosus TaxID=1661398 RepID=A0A482VVL0_ASBVE|nr:Lys domain containing protein [Asbolus verrucosus]